MALSVTVVLLFIVLVRFISYTARLACCFARFVTNYLYDAPPDLKVPSVELCECPPGYQGTSCENCELGYFKESDGPYGPICAPCNCHGHAQICHPLTGKCVALKPRDPSVMDTLELNIDVVTFCHFNPDLCVVDNEVEVSLSACRRAIHTLVIRLGTAFFTPRLVRTTPPVLNVRRAPQGFTVMRPAELQTIVGHALALYRRTSERTNEARRFQDTKGLTLLPLLFSFALSCDSLLYPEEGENGYCVCKPNYMGDRCQYCGPGYYGQPEIVGTRSCIRKVTSQ